MANTNLQLGLDLCETNNCKTIKLSELTGVYEATFNPGGWDDTGLINPALADVTRIVLYFTFPDLSVQTFDSNIVGTLTFPTEDTTLEYPWSMTDFDSPSGTPFTDGEYIITYYIEGTFLGNAYTATVTSRFFLTCQTQCCIDKLFHAASQSDCTDCKNEKLDKALEAESYLKSAQYAADCTKINMAKKHLAKAQWICNNKNCLNCG